MAITKRNYEWPKATSFNGYFTQDSEGGVTEAVSPDLVKEYLANEGFLNSLQTVVNSLVDAGFIYVRLPEVEHNETTYSGALESNVLHIFNNPLVSLEYTLSPMDTAEGHGNEYRFQFVATEGFTITHPSGLLWESGDAVSCAAGITYEISIRNNLAIWAEFVAV